MLKNYLIILSLIMITTTTACAEALRMPTAKEVFPDGHVAMLADAACKGKVSKIDQLVSEGVDVNARGEKNATVLFWALDCRNLKGVQALLKHGANPNARYDTGWTPVLFVGHHDDSRFLKALLDHGGDVNAYNTEHFDTVLRRAFAYGVHKGYWDSYHLLIERGANYDKPVIRQPDYDVSIETNRGSFLDFICGVYARFEEAERLFDKGFEGDIEELIKSVEQVYEKSLASDKIIKDRERFLKKLYAVGEARILDETTIKN